MSRHPPSTSAIEQALEQIRSITRATEQTSASRRLATDVDTYTRYRDALSGATAVRRASDAIAVQDPYRAVGLPAVYDPFATAQAELDRARALALDPYASVAFEPEAGLAADTRRLLAHARGDAELDAFRRALDAGVGDRGATAYARDPYAHIAYEPEPGLAADTRTFLATSQGYVDAELDALRRAAEAAGLSHRGSEAYANDVMKLHGSYDPAPLAYDYGAGGYETVPAAEARRLRRHLDDAGAPVARARVPDTSFADELPQATQRRVSRRRGGEAPLAAQAPAPVDSVGELGEQLRQRRLAMGLSQQEFADMAGVGRRFLSELESGKESVELGRVIRVCRAAGLSLRIG